MGRDIEVDRRETGADADIAAATDELVLVVEQHRGAPDHAFAAADRKRVGPAVELADAALHDRHHARCGDGGDEADVDLGRSVDAEIAVLAEDDADAERAAGAQAGPDLRSKADRAAQRVRGGAQRQQQRPDGTGGDREPRFDRDAGRGARDGDRRRRDRNRLCVQCAHRRECQRLRCRDGRGGHGARLRGRRHRPEAVVIGRGRGGDRRRFAGRAVRLCGHRLGRLADRLHARRRDIAGPFEMRLAVATIAGRALLAAGKHAHARHAARGEFLDADIGAGFGGQHGHLHRPVLLLGGEAEIELLAADQPGEHFRREGEVGVVSGEADSPVAVGRIEIRGGSLALSGGREQLRVGANRDLGLDGLAVRPDLEPDHREAGRDVDPGGANLRGHGSTSWSSRMCGEPRGRRAPRRRGVRNRAAA